MKPRRRPQLRLVKPSPAPVIRNRNPANVRRDTPAWLGGVDCGCDALGQTPAASEPVTVDPALLEREITKLAERYDAERPAVSFSRWAADQGAAELVSAYKELLRSVGASDVIAALDATPAAPPETPEQRIAKFDAPLQGGPWALNAAGQWFTVTTPAPGSRVVESDGRQIYVPPAHASVFPATAACIARADKRFTDQKFRAVNRVTLQRDWRTLFHRVAPRGWTADAGGISAPRIFEGTPDDYDAEGGELYPDLEPGDARGVDLWNWWAATHQNWCDPWGGLSPLAWLSVYTDSEGYQRYKDFSLAERTALNSDWRLARPELTCDPGQTTEEAAKYFHRNEGYKAGQGDGRRERDYSPYWAWAVLDPLNRCQVSSSKRRRKAYKKAAAIAAVVVGAVFLGPMVAGAVKGAAAKGAGMLAKISTAAAKVMPKVIQGVNAAQTVKAMRDGEVPPPPISLTGERFVDYASAIGTNLVERELQEQGQQVAAAERALIEQQMQAQVRELQSRALQQFPVPPSQIPTYTLPAVSGDVRAAMDAPASDLWKAGAVAGAALLIGLMFSR